MNEAIKERDELFAAANEAMAEVDRIQSRVIKDYALAEQQRIADEP